MVVMPWRIRFFNPRQPYSFTSFTFSHFKLPRFAIPDFFIFIKNTHFMKLVHCIIALSLPLTLLSQQIHYEFSAPNAAHHEAEITLTVKGLKPGIAVFRMSRSSPGRYATHEFGKNVYNVSAVDGAGKKLPVEKTDAEVYQVNQQQGTVKLTYTLYGNYADGTYAGIDENGYHLNMPAAFMWIRGLDDKPITLQFKTPAKDWKVATQLKPTNDPFTFTAPGLQYFMDAPTKLGNLHTRQWIVTNPDQKKYTVRLALEAETTDSLLDIFTQKLQKIVKESQAIFGEVPAYDYGTYTFIAGINPYMHGDGMEHRNSTMITGRERFAANGSLNTFAHEFFHCWNVERIRPKSLEPFNFEKSNMSEALWVAEGFTQYYTSLIMKRSGLLSLQDFNRQIANLVNAKENTPGGKYYSPVENSRRAVFVDAGVAVDQNNYRNMFTSYYSHGAALALALDLQLRTQFNKSLDGFMLQMWKTFGKTEKAYTLPEMERLLAGYSTPVFASTFFKNNVYAVTSINYTSLLQAAGLAVTKPFAGKAWMGNMNYTMDTTKLVIAGNTLKNTPLYKAGVDVDDVLLQVGEMKVIQPEEVDAELAQHKPGETIRLVYKHRDVVKEKTITLEEDPLVSVVPVETTGAPLTATQNEFRKLWLDSKAGNGTE
jgi:predicted metalloprotease with PDZ domain